MDSLSAQPTVLTDCGVPWIWGADVEKGWAFMRFNVFPIMSRFVMPGSHGYGADRIPGAGGAVLASNHLSAVDGPLIGLFSRRAIWFMMKSELAEIPIVGEALSWTGGFPVSREACSPDSIRNARDLVHKHIIGVFPEGTRQRCGYPADRIQRGAVAIALRESVPIIPCAVETFQWSFRNRRACCVVYGDPMTFPGIRATSDGCREAAELVRREIFRLWRQAAEAVAQGFPSELPDGTRRNRPTRLSEFVRVCDEDRRVSGFSRARLGAQQSSAAREKESAIRAMLRREAITVRRSDPALNAAASAAVRT